FYQQVYFHRLGTPEEKDPYVIGKEFPRIAEIKLASSDDGRHVLATVANGDGGEFAHYLRDPNGAWTQVTRFEYECTYGVLASGVVPGRRQERVRDADRARPDVARGLLGLRGRPGVRDIARRDKGPPQYHSSEGHEARRKEPDAPERVRGLWDQHHPILRRPAARVDRAGRHDRD